MAIKHRLISNGVLITVTEFNEIDQATIDITKNAVFADELDEVSSTPVPMRFARDKRILIVPGYFDEVTGILTSSTPESIFIFPSTSIFPEGRYISFSVSNLDPSVNTYYWTILHVQTDEDDFDQVSGSFQTVLGAGAFQVKAKLDRFTDNGNELFRIEIRDQSITGPVLATSQSVSIYDNSQDQVSLLQVEGISVEEGFSITFVVQGLSAGSYYWRIRHGSTEAADFLATAGFFVYTSDDRSRRNYPTFTITLVDDFLTEGPETFFIDIEDSWSNNIVQSSAVIVAVDTSQALNFNPSSLTVQEGSSYTAVFGNRTDIELYWFTKLGLSGLDYISGIAVDADDNIYITGKTPSTQSGNTDIFVSKLNYNGNVAWQRRIGTTVTQENSEDIVITRIGDLAVVGNITDSALTQCLHICRINTSGTVLWEYRYPFTSKGYGIDYYSDYFYVTGYETVNGVNYLLVIKLTRNTGKVEWVRRIGSAGQHIVGNKISLTTSDRIAIVGTVSNLTNTSHKLIVLSLDLAGNIIWQTEFSNATNSFGNGIDTTSSKFYVIGTSELGPGQFYLTLLKFNFDGTLDWQRKLGGTNSEYGLGIVVDTSTTDVLVTGSTADNLLVARFSSVGDLTWQNKISRLDVESGRDICLNDEGNFQVVGQIYDTVDYNSMLIAKLPSNGTLTGSYDNIEYIQTNLVVTASTLTNTASTYPLINPGHPAVDYLFIPLENSTITSNVNFVDKSNTGDYFIAQYNQRVTRISTNLSNPIVFSRVVGGFEGSSTNPDLKILRVDPSGNYCYLGFNNNTFMKSDSTTGLSIWAKTILPVRQRPIGFLGTWFQWTEFKALQIDSSNNIRLILHEGETRYNSINDIQIQSTQGLYIISSTTGDRIARWLIELSGNSFQLNSIRLDSLGNTYIGGYRLLTSSTNTNPKNAIVLKLDSTGNQLFTATIKLSALYNYDAIIDIVVDSTFNIYALVYTKFILSNSPSDEIPVLVKLNPNGVVLWHLTIGSEVSVGALAIDSLDNIYVTTKNIVFKCGTGGQISWIKKVYYNQVAVPGFTSLHIDETNNILSLMEEDVIIQIPLDGSLNLENQGYKIVSETASMVLSSALTSSSVDVNLFTVTVSGNYSTPSVTVYENSLSTLVTVEVVPLYTNIIQSSSTPLLVNTYTINPVTGFIPNKTYYWRILHGTTNSNDFVTTNGYVTVTNGQAEITVTTVQDYVLEGLRSFRIQLVDYTRPGPIPVGYSSGTLAFQTPDIFINDTSFVPTVTPNVTSVNEGSSVIFTLSYIGSAGTYYWTTDSSDLTTASGTVSITNGAGTITVTVLADLITEGSETFTLSIRKTSITGEIIVTSEAITINDTSTDVIITPNITSVVEGQSIVVAVTNINPNGTYYWTILHETTVAANFTSISGSFTSVANIASFSINTIHNYIVEGPRTFRIQIRRISTSGPVIKTSDSLTVDDSTLIPTLTHAADVNEGSSITISGTNIGPAGTYYWTTNNNIDVVNSGTVVISSGAGSFSISAISDYTTEGIETFTVSIRSGSVVGPVIVTSTEINIIDTSLSPTLTVNPNPVDEDQTVTVTVSNVFPSTAETFYWTLFPITASRDEFNLESGTVNIVNGTGTFTFNPLKDYLTEGVEIFKVRLRRYSTTGPVLVTSDEITINDTSLTPSISVSSNEVNENGFVVVTVTTSQITDTLYWTILDETTTADDFYETSGAFSISNYIGSFEVNIYNEYDLTEPSQSFKVQIRRDSISGPIIATSESITIINNSTDSTVWGESVYTTQGTYTWVCPDGVHAVNAVAVGGGGGGTYTSGSAGNGGGGGGLGWRNRIRVVPGQSYTVVVGARGEGEDSEFGTSYPATSGGDSYFISPLIVKGGGGRRGETGTGFTGSPDGAGGTYVGTGGGIGGSGVSVSSGAGGGGGAGGYTGKGGNGSNNSVINPGQGGGGAGGSGTTTFSLPAMGQSNPINSTGGGGVGIYGQGTSGTTAGQGGSGGTDGTQGQLLYFSWRTSYGGFGGQYGGGGGSPIGGGGYPGYGYRNGGVGGSGAVRIIWGKGRSYPNAVQNVQLITTEGVEEGEILTVSVQLPIDDIKGIYYWKIVHVTSTESQFVSTSGSIDLSNSLNGSFSIQTVISDPFTTNQETFKIELSDQPLGSTLFATTGNITIYNRTLVTGEFILSGGSQSWICPADVYDVSVVCIGGGGGGSKTRAGGGGGLAWKNKIRVIPGQSYTVSAGFGGSVDSVGSGTSSYFRNTDTIVGYGGTNGESNLGSGGLYVGDGGGAGGRGSGGSIGTNRLFFNGGGAGNYTSNGPAGTNSIDVGQRGPGSSLFGIGGGGTLYGGGGYGASEFGVNSQPGDIGAVRIIWGPGRSFPNNAA